MLPHGFPNASPIYCTFCVAEELDCNFSEHANSELAEFAYCGGTCVPMALSSTCAYNASKDLKVGVYEEKRLNQKEN